MPPASQDEKCAIRLFDGLSFIWRQKTNLGDMSIRPVGEEFVAKTRKESKE